ncbi:unnamed protein product [Miscanthus lutarioriparius]|uniref:Protein kinase domain-containing protein n=1 Tax=Miscanthus lutarioriparius TaxID=422564 RepID=A0A811PNJ4_9POAL|nr:unnamed protein product [Miscanthus lutarioriparius]
MCSTGVLLARACAVLMCLAVVARAPPAKVHAMGTGNGHLGIPTNASLAHCPSYCGDVKISYPFGIGPGCFRQGFELTCDSTTGSPRLIFQLGNNSTQVTSIDVGSNYVWASAVGYNITMGLGVDTYTQSWEAPTGVVIDSMNSIYVVGCGVDIYMFGDNTTDLIGSCMSICPDNREIMERANMGYGACEGFGCCAIWSSLAGRQAITLKLGRRNSTIALLDEARSSIKVIFSEYYHFVIGDLYASWVNTSNVRGMLLDIAITDRPSCASAQSQENNDTYACNSESICRDLPVSRGGYNCFCPGQMEGNPYVVAGCIDYNPKAPNDNCTRLCGNITIPFPFGIEEGCFANDNLRLNCTSNNTTILDRGYAQYRVTNLSLDDGLMTVTNMLNDTSSNNMERVVITDYDGQYQSFYPTYEEVVDDNFDFSQEFVILMSALFQTNAMEYATTLMEASIVQVAVIGKTIDITKRINISERMIITLRDIEKATHNFDRDHVIGGGGHGVVFKGILDQHVVAIKKSKIVVQREIDEFINEVVVLSQVNHRNVVKLLGCCLETAVPLLIYEFISNGTLYHHLHVEEAISLTWADRLRIALEVARALSYLHSSASMPIFHRDIKTANILLDDSLVAKVSDFGASRYITIDQTGVTTAIQGTIGYLDPMYYSTGRLTDKSDVFSFGVVLIELLTRKKPFLYCSDNGDGIVSHFASRLIEDKLVDIIDPQVMEEEDGEIIEVATLATLCTKLKGEDRPTMREVEMTLENLLFKKKHPPCNTSSRRYGQNKNSYKPMTEQITNEASRQYTMEEEILLSATYAR